MSRTLFCANEVLQGALVHVRSLCEAASGSLTGVGEGAAAISLVRLDKTFTPTLDQFVATQQEQGLAALAMLAALHDTVVDIVGQACGVSETVRQTCDGEKQSKQAWWPIHSGS